MAGPMKRRTLPAVAIAILLLGGCAASAPAAKGPAEAAVPAAPPRPADLGAYLDTLSGMAPGDTGRQQATLEAALAASQQSPTAANRLRYALALGSAGSAGSNPVEARRMILELLSGPHDLKAAEVALAESFLREFEARVTLYAELGRQREEAAARLASLDASADHRTDALAAENARLRRALAEADRKLKAVAEMERQLLEQVSEPASPDAPPP